MIADNCEMGNTFLNSSQESSTFRFRAATEWPDNFCEKYCVDDHNFSKTLEASFSLRFVTRYVIGQTACYYFDLRVFSIGGGGGR